MAHKFTSALINPNLPKWKVKLYDTVLSLLPFLAIRKANRILVRHKGLKDKAFIDKVTKDLKIEIVPTGFEEMVKDGPVTIVANHPGGADVIATISAVGGQRRDMKILANSLICIDPVKEIVIPVNMFAKQKVDDNLIHEAYKNGNAVVFFAAGKNSRYNAKGELRDRRWRTTFLNFAKEYNTPIHIMRIEDKNSPLFYKVSRIRMKYKSLRNVPLENMFQLRELVRPKSNLKIMLSKPIYLKDEDKEESIKELRQKADKMQAFLYEMNENNLDFGTL